MFESNGVVDNRRDGDMREPIFRDVPFEQSEWAGLYAVLRQVNQLKAELVRVQYEAVRIAYQNYLEARHEELVEYAERRREDEAYNREVYDRREQLAQKIDAIRQRWEEEIHRLRTQLEAADVEAYRRAGLAGMNLRGDPLLGIGLLEEETRAGDTHQPLTETQVSTPTTPATDPSTASLPAQSLGQSPPPRASFWERLLGAERTEHATTLAAQSASAATGSTASASTATSGASFATAPPEPVERIEPLTEAEAAHRANLPTNQSLVIPHWLHWAAPILIGLAIGQILLVAAGRPVGDWESLAFWVASLAGVLMMLLWYRAVWGMSRAISELYYLFDWGAVKARRTAWLGGLALILLLILPTTLLIIALYLLPSIGAQDAPLLTVLVLLVTLPLLGLALVGGYLQGRAQVVQDAVQSAVVAAKREHQHQERAQAHQERLQQEQRRLEQEREHTERMTHLHAQTHAPGEPPSPSTPASTPTHDLLPAAPTTADGSGAGNSLSNGTTISVAEPASPVISPSEKFQLRQSAFEAISYARGVYANYRRAHELMHEELALYEQLAGELQPRPLYDSLPPWAEQRLRTLYDQWRDAYSAFLDYVAEAARECKDSEQIQQRIADFKQTLMR